MTQTILSAASSASPKPQGPALNECVSTPSAKHPEPHLDAGLVAQALLPVRSCHVEREEPPPTAASHTTKILIANLELEFQLTYRKLSPLRISNRKFSPAFASSILLAIPLHGCEQIERHSPLVAVRSNLRFRD